MRVAALVPAAAAALALSACGGGGAGSVEPRRGGAGAPDGGPAAPAGVAPGPTVVDMNDRLAFVPRKLRVSAGEKVTWRNVGKIAHTITADRSKAADPELVGIPEGTKEWDSGFVGEDEAYSRTFDEPGTYSYICVPHEGAGMVGTVVVEGG